MPGEAGARDKGLTVCGASICASPPPGSQSYPSHTPRPSDPRPQHSHLVLPAGWPHPNRPLRPPLSHHPTPRQSYKHPHPGSYPWKRAFAAVDAGVAAMAVPNSRAPLQARSELLSGLVAVYQVGPPSGKKGALIIIRLTAASASMGILRCSGPGVARKEFACTEPAALFALPDYAVPACLSPVCSYAY
jgi:hypothetical protein